MASRSCGNSGDTRFVRDVGTKLVLFEPLPSGPSPVVSKLRKADGTMDIMFATVTATVGRRPAVLLVMAGFAAPRDRCWEERTLPPLCPTGQR